MNRFKTAAIVLIALAAPAFCTKALAEDESQGAVVATVDINRLLNGLDESKKKKAELDRLSVKAKGEIDARKKKLEQLKDKLESRKDSPKDSEVESYRKEVIELERYVKDAEEDLKRRFLKFNNDLTERALTAIRSFAEKNKIDLVLDKGHLGKSPVLFGSQNTDITDSIIKAMNSAG